MFDRFFHTIVWEFGAKKPAFVGVAQAAIGIVAFLTDEIANRSAPHRRTFTI